MKSINLNFYNNSLNKKQQFQVIIGILVNIFTIFVELFSITALIPLIIVILKGDLSNIDLGLLNNFKNNFENYLVIENLQIIVLFTFFLFLFKSIFFLFINYYNAWLQGNITTIVSNRIYYKYLKKNFSNSNSKSSAELINDCTSVAEDFVKNSFIATILAFKSFLTLFFILIFLFIIYTKIIITIFSALFVIYLIYYLLAKKFLIKLGKKKLKLSQTLIKLLKETSSALKEIKLYTLENKFIDNHFLKKFQLERVKRLEKIITNLPKSFSEIIILLFIFILILFQNIEQNSINLALTVSVLGYSALRIIPQVIFIVRYYNKLNYVRFVAEKVINIINDKSDFKSTYENIENIELKKEIRLKNISFKYNDTNKEIFNDLNFSIKKGEIIGIVGESGVGKTTLINIMSGLIGNFEGKIIIDDKEINFDTCNWQNKIALIPQEVMYFDASILENITLNLSKKIDETFFDRILEKSQTKNFIKQLPEGVDTNIGEDGKTLSAGQRQRLGIARALYRDPELMIFDEVTSSLDDENENKIVETIKDFKGKKTIIIISHKKKPLEICDIIYKIENKKVNVLN